MLRASVLTLACLLPLVGCAADPDFNYEDCADGDSDDPKCDHWNSINDPARWAEDLNYALGDLPTSGRTDRVAWASTYWPTYQDSTNVRWQGHDELSPMEKWDLAFNDWEPAEGFMELKPMTGCGADFDPEYYEQLGPAAAWITKHRGNERMRDGLDSDGDGEADECGEDFDGIGTWWGLCHAWVPAAMLEDEPLSPVTVNGVTFEVSDLAALLITAYDRTHAQMLGGRCNAMEVDREENSERAVPDECRDTNAGAFHVIITNYLGLRNQAIAEDRTFDFEVWNQPVTGYEVTELAEISAREANELLGIDSDEYTYNADAVRFAEVRLTTDYITESHASREPTTDIIDRYTRHDHYHYVLELDENDLIIGGEWVGDSHDDHPDFLWLPLEASSYGNNPFIDLDRIRELVAQSREVEPEPGTGDAPDLLCEGAYRDPGERCRFEGNGRFAPAMCCR